MNKSEFLIKSQEIYGSNVYDYSKVPLNIRSKEKITIECLKHNAVFQQQIGNHLQGKQGCPICQKSLRTKLKKTQEQVINEFLAIHGDKYDYSKVIYKGALNPIEIICPIHGSFWQTASKHLCGNCCPKCRGKRNTEEFIEEARQVHGDKYDYSISKYTKAADPIDIICPLHGKFTSCTAISHLKGVGCPVCGHLRINVSEWEEVLKQYPNYILECDDPTRLNLSTRIKITCKKHGVVIDKKYGSVKNAKQDFCPECIRERLEEKFIKEASEAHKGFYDYSKVKYTNSTDKVEVICPKHGSFFVSPNNHVSKLSGCPRCAKTVSKCENDIYEFVKEMCPDAIQSDRTFLGGGLELDILCHSKKIAIEFDGLRWHADERGKKLLDKTNLCEEKGYQLIHIFEDEWYGKQLIVRDRLKHIFGYSENKVGARKCIVKQISSQFEREFYNRTHIQGYVASSYCFGLFYNDKLVAAMSFKKPRFNKKYEWELLRYSCERGYNVIGGAGKLLNHFRKTISNKPMISYADRRWSVGRLYTTLGFKKESITKPSYFYFNDRYTRYSRVKFQKNKLNKLLDTFDSNLSESKNMKNNGYFKIYDCGTIAFVLV